MFPVQAPDGPAERAFVDHRREGQRGLSFTEVMTGFIYTGHEISDFDAAEDAARTQQLSAQCFLTVDAFDKYPCEQRTARRILLFLTMKTPSSALARRSGSILDRHLLKCFSRQSSHGHAWAFRPFHVGQPQERYSKSDIRVRHARH